MVTTFENCATTLPEKLRHITLKFSNMNKHKLDLKCDNFSLTFKHTFYSRHLSIS